MLRQLLEYQHRIDALRQQASQIVPVPLRRAPVQEPVKIRSLVTYSRDGVSSVMTSLVLRVADDPVNRVRL